MIEFIDVIVNENDISYNSNDSFQVIQEFADISLE